MNTNDRSAWLLGGWMDGRTDEWIRDGVLYTGSEEQLGG